MVDINIDIMYIYFKVDKLCLFIIKKKNLIFDCKLNVIEWIDDILIRYIYYVYVYILIF